MSTAKRAYVEERLESLRRVRDSWWTHWRELATYILPRRMQYLISPNQIDKGLGYNTAIVDPTGTIAARVCGAGMMSGVTSPARPWFALRIGKWTNEGDNQVAIWISEVEDRMERVAAESNIYNCLASAHTDNVVFGTAPILLYEDFEDVIRGYPCVTGEYFIGLDGRNYPNTLYREFTMTAGAIEGMFKDDGELPVVVKNALQNATGRDQEFIVCHAIEPNTHGYARKGFKFWECYWIKGSARESVLRNKGYYEQPFICLRWEIRGNDPYGHSPGMDALPEIKQLQHETKRKAQAIDKMVTPPLVADIQLQNKPTSLLPGGVTYVSGASQVGVKPIFTVMPPVQEMMGDIREIQSRIKTIFYNDLFMMISQLDTVRSASEINERREEKLVMLGPVLDGLQNEALDPFIDRMFGIMQRGGLFPPPPPEIRGMNIEVKYVSMLAEAQAATTTVGIERLLGYVGTLAAGQPDVMDTFNSDASVIEYARALRVSPKLIRDAKQIAALRAEREQAQKTAQMLEQTNAGAQAAKTMSEAEVGGGQNALSMIMGGG